MRLSIKMRASVRVPAPQVDGDIPLKDHRDLHVSGAERIVTADDLTRTVTEMEHRAWTHPKGQPDDIVISIHRVKDNSIRYIPALPRETRHTRTVSEAHHTITTILHTIGVPVADQALKTLTHIRGMRGAILLDADTGERRDTNGCRGVRVTAVDNDMPTCAPATLGISNSELTKSYYSEALTLASKVQSHPAVCAEVCISDDPDYTTGYISTPEGYIRIDNIKPAGSPQGGRVFLVRGTDDEIANCIDYLENTPVIVQGIPWPPEDQASSSSPIMTDTVDRTSHEHKAPPHAVSPNIRPHTVPITTFATRSLASWEATGLRRYPLTFSSLTLASKVQSHPAVCAEVCISDDPDYTTGYISTPEGYIRIDNIKPAGSPQGGRVFLVRGTDDEIANCIDYLENTPVIVQGIPWPPEDQASSSSPIMTDTVDRTSHEHKAPPHAVSPNIRPHTVPITTFATRSLASWEATGLRRYPLTFSSPPSPHSLVSGSETLLFSSSNYLGLSEHPAVVAAATRALHQYGAGTGGSRLTTGNFSIHSATERALASFTGYEDAVLFGTGYQANTTTLAALAADIPEVPGSAPAGTPGMTIFSDARNHASVIDGIRLATRGGAQVHVYPHTDMEYLDHALAQCSSPRTLIVSDGVFSMHGDVAPLPDIMQIARTHGAWVLIDDAHGIGTLGRTGRGIVEHVEDSRRSAGPMAHDYRPDLLVVTSSKALGSEGAAVCCAAPVAEFLRHRARGYMFSTSSAPASVAATQAAIDVIAREPERVATLQGHSQYVRDRLRSLDIPLCEGNDDRTPIIPIMIGDETDAVRVSQGLSERGIHVPAIRYPTVRRGEAILRVTTMATHTREHLDLLVDALATVMSAH